MRYLGCGLAVLVACGGAGGGAETTPEGVEVSTRAVSRPAREEEVVFDSAGLALRGTLLLPERAGPVPGVVLVHGSGPNSRDELLLGQLNMGFPTPIAVFREIAVALRDAGFAVLRYDKRSCGPFNQCADNGYPMPGRDVTARHFVADAEAALRFLGERPEVEDLFVIGHSQGGAFVPLLVDSNPSVRAGVMLAANHAPLDEVVAGQIARSRETFARTQLPEAQAAALLAHLEAIVSGCAQIRAGTYTEPMLAGVSVEFWRSTFALAEEAHAAALRLERPLLVVSGEYDWNVPPSETRAWEELLAPRRDGGVPHQFGLFACVTHGLNCVTQPDYLAIQPGDVGAHVHPLVITTITDFLMRHRPG